MDLIFYLNSTRESLPYPSQGRLLDFLRQKRLCSVKEGCREGECGACSVLMSGTEGLYTCQLSCLVPLSELHQKHIITLEGLNGPDLTLVQELLYRESAAQCGFCTPGFVIGFYSFLSSAQNYTFEEWKEAVEGNFCRCTGYGAIKRAGQKLVEYLRERFPHPPKPSQRLPWLVQQGFFPPYLLTIQKELQTLPTLSESPTKGHWVAGGTDLLVQHPVLTEPLHTLSHREDLRGVQKTDTALVLGAATTFEEFAQHPLTIEWLPQLPKFARKMASQPLRRRATLGGNLANASPIADMAILLLALKAEVDLWHPSQNTSRRLPLSQFFLGYKHIALEQGELIRRILLPLPPTPTAWKVNFEKVSRRPFLDIASVNTAICLEVEEDHLQRVTLSMGGVAPVPLYLKKTSQFLFGKPLHRQTLEEALSILQTEISPISDVRGSQEYKRLLARQLFLAHFLELFPQHARDWEDLVLTKGKIP